MARMFEVEEKAQARDEDFGVLKAAALNSVIPLLLRLLKIGGRSIQPCLVHSNLWPGNCMPDADTGEIMLLTDAHSGAIMKQIWAAGELLASD